MVMFMRFLFPDVKIRTLNNQSQSFFGIEKKLYTSFYVFFFCPNIVSLDIFLR